MPKEIPLTDSAPQRRGKKVRLIRTDERYLNADLNMHDSVGNTVVTDAGHYISQENYCQWYWWLLVERNVLKATGIRSIHCSVAGSHSTARLALNHQSHVERIPAPFIWYESSKDF